MKRFLLAGAAIATLGLSDSRAAPERAAAGGRPEPISFAEVVERTDRDAIRRSLRILGVIPCREGRRMSQAVWVENLWPYGITESTPERQDDYSTIEEFKELFHAHECDVRETTVFAGGRASAMEMRSGSTYTYAPLPSWLLLGDDRRKNNWAFPDPEARHARVALAHDSGLLDPAWSDAALAGMMQPTRPKATAFADCFKSADAIGCFGKWGPRDGSFVRTGWQLDASRRSRLLAMLYSASLAREGPEGYRTPWQTYASSTGRGHTTYHLIPRETGPEPGSGWIQVIFPEREDAMAIGDPAVFEDKKNAPDRMAVIVYGTFRRPAEPGAPCDSVRMMPPLEASR